MCCLLFSLSKSSIFCLLRLLLIDTCNLLKDKKRTMKMSGGYFDVGLERDNDMRFPQYNNLLENISCTLFSSAQFLGEISVTLTKK